MPKQILVITGPTASGKTFVAHQLAQNKKLQIISFDSRQVYKELKIGVARPPDEFLREVNYHFIASHSIHDPLSAGAFAKLCRQKIQEILANDNVVILVGGTGFYLKAILEDTSSFPLKNTDTRKYYLKIFNEYGLNFLQKLLKEKSQDWFHFVETSNPARVLRALEILHEYPEALPQKITQGYFQNFDTRIFVLDLPREMLYENINRRVDEMMEQGLKQEALDLAAYSELLPLKTVGYREWYEHKNATDDEIVNLIKQNTRRYAKRQMTWFRHQLKDAVFISQTNPEQIIHEINRQLNA
jgi:tRNA dimethylallyltransferase